MVETEKADFVEICRTPIIGWTESHREELLNYRAYRWREMTYEKSVQARNQLEQAISLSRQKNRGGIDLTTVNRIYSWGMASAFPLQDEAETMRITREAFEFLNQNDSYSACSSLLEIPDVGVAGATKILGLSNQQQYCIYDSRVGRALDDLRVHNNKLIKRPGGRSGGAGDYVSSKQEWALNYQRLIWTLQLMREYLKGQASDLRISDLEMALFMKGQLHK